MEKYLKCRRCSKLIEPVKSCGKANCPWWNPRDMWGRSIKKDLGINEVDKYLVENLCNFCSDRLEDTLNAFYACKTVSRDFASLEGGHEKRWWFDANRQKIKVWERDKVQEFDLNKQSLVNILDSMGF